MHNEPDYMLCNLENKNNAYFICPSVPDDSLRTTHGHHISLVKVTTLSGVSYASVYEQTHSRQCCNLLIA